MDLMSEARDRIEPPEALISARAVVLLPPCTLDEAIAPVEVLLQEGLSVFSLPPTGSLTPDILRATFGRRLVVGLHDVHTGAHVRLAVDQRAAFVLCLGAPEVAQELAEARIPHFPAALTPTEVDAVWRGGASGVQVVPAGLFGNSYAGQLAALVPGARLVARGPDSSFEIKAWLGAGAMAVGLGDKVLGDAFRRGDLAALRTRVRPVLEALRHT